MEQQLYLSYLSLLGELSQTLEQLADLVRQQTACVRRDDLIAMDHVMKQEQVKSLALRGYEQKRVQLLKQLGLEKVPLNRLAASYPAELQHQAAQAAEQLQRSYGIYQSAAEVARITLECNLHELDKIITDLGGPEAIENTGYAAPDAQPPKKMKTDFRA